MQSELFLQT